MSRVADDADRLQRAFAGMIRALGLLRPDTTPCGQPVTVTEAHALGELLDHGPMTQQRLADALGLQKSTVSRLVDQLVGADLAARSPNPDDRRSVLVGLTRNGTTRARRLAAARRRLFAGLVEQLDPGDRRTVLAGLTRLEEVARARS
jgi:DNA-binding MarR family transcriptional regulator